MILNKVCQGAKRRVQPQAMRKNCTNSSRYGLTLSSIRYIFYIVNSLTDQNVSDTITEQL